MLPGGLWTLAGLCVALVLVSAKAHGRQVRLARERVGIMQVVFGADNGSVVEAIWRHDRIRFWTGFTIMGMPLLAIAAMGAYTGMGFFLDGQPWVVRVLFAAVMAFATGFIAAGLTAWGRQMRPQPDDPEWLGRANWVSFAWWTLVAALLALIRFAV